MTRALLFWGLRAHLQGTLLGWLVGGLLVGLMPGHLYAQDSTLTRLIRQNQYFFAPSGPQFTGPGWEKLQAAVRQSQLVLVGEDHGLAQIPTFTAAVAQVFQPAVYVTEVDPYVAQTVTRLTAQPGLPAAYLRQYPGALCFYNQAEEFELVRALRAQQVRIVGLDQVFITTAAPFYAELARHVRHKAANAYLRRRALAYQAQEQTNERLGGFAYSMKAQPQAAIDSLLTLAKHENATVQKMVADYAKSYAIYTTQSHQARLNLMKRNLLQEVQADAPAPAQPLPKMLFKFGAFHLARGLSPATFGEYYDVGNLVQNLADAREVRSLHVYITGKQGRQRTGFNPTAESKNVETYTAADSPTFKPFLDQVSGPEWSLIDLRPARRALTQGKLQVAKPNLQRYLLGYDFLVIIPETTASHLF